MVAIAWAATAQTAAAQGDEPLFDPNTCRDSALIDEAALKAYQGKPSRQFRESIRKDRIDDATKENLAQAADYYAFILTTEEGRKNAVEPMKEVMRTYGLRSELEARRYFLGLLVDRLRIVAAQCDVGDRMNALLFLSQLDEADADNKRGTPAVPFWPAGDVMLDMIENPNELAEVKVRAARGLARIFADSDAPRDEYDQLFRRTVAALEALNAGSLPYNNGQGYEWWLAAHLIEALGEVDSPTNLLLEPIGIRVLLDVLNDPQKDDFLRARAARALSKIPYSEGSGFDIQPIVAAQMAFFREWVDRYNEQPLLWTNRHVVSDMYFSFKPESREQFEDGDGWLAQVNESSQRNAAGPVRAAFDVVKPIFASIIQQKTLDQEPLDRNAGAAIVKWLSENPISTTVHPRIPKFEISLPQPAGEAAAATDAAAAAR